MWLHFVGGSYFQLIIDTELHGYNSRCGSYRREDSINEILCILSAFPLVETMVKIGFNLCVLLFKGWELFEGGSCYAIFNTFVSILQSNGGIHDQKLT